MGGDISQSQCNLTCYRVIGLKFTGVTGQTQQLPVNGIQGHAD